MLREIHIKNIENHKYNIIDESISTSLLKPVWIRMQSYIPFCIAPNIITLTGLLSTILSTYICYKYYDNYPIITTLCAIFFTIAYINLDAIDGIHARKTKNSSAIGELLDHGCDSVSTILLSMMFCKLLNINNNILIWKFMVTSSLGFLVYHYNSYKAPATFGKYTGPVEILSYFLILTGLNLLVPSLVNIVVGKLVDLIGLILIGLTCNTFYLTFDKYMTKHHTVMTWLIKSLLVYIGFRYIRLTPTVKLEQIFYDGCAISFVTWEILLNSIAKRDCGFVTIAILLSYYLSGYVGLLLSSLLIVGYIKEIASAMHMNILTQNINVYCCGVYDLCHYGHKVMFKQALQFGNRLIVGVHNDKEVESYKRTPIMTMNERIREVETSKYVWKVVPNALLSITEKELDDLNVHIVVCCQDYYNDTDTWYSVPRKYDILRPIPYTPEISTTDLIKRCKEHA